jgi:transcriptional regulator with XRE-family HTH domain
MNDKIIPEPPLPIGAQIRLLRQERALTLSALAGMAGTSAPTMHRYESGWDRFEMNTLRKIAAALGASLEVRLIPSPELLPSAIQNPRRLLTLLAPLFWDRELKKSELEIHGNWVLGRVLMFGTRAQVRAARSYYGDESIRLTIQRREIDSRTRNYWRLILEESCTPRF